jgi:hypothetical protein
MRRFLCAAASVSWRWIRVEEIASVFSPLELLLVYLVILGGICNEGVCNASNDVKTVIFVCILFCCRVV